MIDAWHGQNETKSSFVPSHICIVLTGISFEVFGCAFRASDDVDTGQPSLRVLTFNVAKVKVEETDRFRAIGHPRGRLCGCSCFGRGRKRSDCERIAQPISLILLASFLSGQAWRDIHYSIYVKTACRD